MKEKIQEKNLPLLSSFPFSLEICKRETELSGRHHPRNPICSKSLTIFVGYAFALKWWVAMKQSVDRRPPTTHTSNDVDSDYLGGLVTSLNTSLGRTIGRVGYIPSPILGCLSSSSRGCYGHTTKTIHPNSFVVTAICSIFALEVRQPKSRHCDPNGTARVERNVKNSERTKQNRWDMSKSKRRGRFF